MKKIIIYLIIILLIFFIGKGIYQINSEKNNVENKVNSNTEIKDNKLVKTDGINSVLTLDDEITNDTIWCGTFQLIWNDLKNDLAKQDIVFTPQKNVVKNLNKETFSTKDISEKYYYKKIGTPSIELKQEIENAIKEKFNEKSDILDDFNWSGNEKDYFLYAMLKKDFQFEKAFDELEKSNFKTFSGINYFGIKKNTDNSELRNQVEVLYYNSKEDFAIKLKTKQEDEVILCKSPKGISFNEIYNNILKQKDEYKGNRNLEEKEIVKIPNLNIKEKNEFTELENNEFYFANGDTYIIDRAIQTIQFELDKTGGKIKSEAGMSTRVTSLMPEESPREFSIDDSFAIFLIENGKEHPYFAGKIDDITKFQNK